MLNIINTRRLSQLFFFVLFLWFCFVATLGEQWWQLRGWPINWFLQLDPLVGLGVLLATHTLFTGLLWCVLTIVLTLLLGRFFCGWVCPMGALQQFVGYIGMLKVRSSQLIRRNQPHAAQRIKYWILIYLLAAAAVDLVRYLLSGPSHDPVMYGALCLLLVALGWALGTTLKDLRSQVKTVCAIGVVVMAGAYWQWRFPHIQWLDASLQIGLLDPLCFLYRSVNLVLLPVVDNPMQVAAAIPRFYVGGALIGLLFLVVILLCWRVPRFYCRFICPLGALLGLLSRWSLWRMGKSEDKCRECHQCEAHCEGACAPSQSIQIAECVLCLNCMDQCRHRLMGYRLQPSATGEVPGPDLSRRHAVSAVAAGVLTIPLMRIGGGLGGHWNPQVIRPPGALNEAAFLTRCIKCGQCMRVCPTNVIHPANWQAGVEGLWTPVLNFRVGTSGCQHNCVACSHVCPTAALRPLSLDERMGRNTYADAGPLRTGMAFIDRGRCLPWAMDTPCIVCQENCPVSPKAIFTRVEYRPVRQGAATVRAVDGHRMTLEGPGWTPNAFAGGDFFIKWLEGQQPLAIQSNTVDTITLEPAHGPPMDLAPGQAVHITVRLQKPYVDPHQCIGCGVCEHECPVQGRRAIRITAENESRHPDHRMVIQ